jgi:exosortase
MENSDKKLILFLLFTAVAIAMALSPLKNLIRYERTSDYYMHIPLIPAISAYIFIRRRKEIFFGSQAVFIPGVLFMAVGAGLFLFARPQLENLYAYAGMSTLSALVFFWGSFLLAFGPEAFRKAWFPLVFLVIAIPVPTALIERLISILVTASTLVTRLLFQGFGVPFVQQDSIFYLPGFDIEVSHECSGIRSSLALLITSLLAGHIFLKKFWKSALLVLSVFPVTVFKNGVRIITLYLLSYFVDMRIIDGGFLHRSGGFIFFGMGLIILGYILRLLRKS